MGTTARGFPYPENSDQVALGAQAIRSLAEAVDTRSGVQASGNFSITVNNAVSATTTITLPANRFTAAPNVVATANHNSWFAFMGTPSAGSFTIGVVNRAGTAGTQTMQVYWVAMTAG